MERASDRTPVLIYGAGSVGCYLGGMLAASGHTVTLLGRASLRAAIAARGLRIERPDGSIAAHVDLPVITTIDHLDVEPALVVLATKAYDVCSALPDIATLSRHRGDGISVLAIQNGVGTDAMLAGALPGVNITAGALTISLDSPEPGQIRLTSDRGGLAIASVTNEDVSEPLARIFDAARIDTRRVSDYHAMRWSKLLLNLMGNAASAVIGWTPERIYRHAGLFVIERAAFREAVRVMRAAGTHPVSLPGFSVPLLTRVMRLPEPLSRRLIASRVAAARGDKLPSMRIDVESGRGRSEVGWLNGAVVAAGEGFEIDTPVNRRLVRLVEGVTGSDALRRGFAERPDLLMQNIGLAPR